MPSRSSSVIAPSARSSWSTLSMVERERVHSTHAILRSFLMRPSSFQKRSDAGLESSDRISWYSWQSRSIACACHWGSSFRKSFQSDSFTPPDSISPLFHLVRASQDAARPEASAMLCPPHTLALSHAEVRADLFGQGIRAGVLPLPSRRGLCRSMDKSTKPSAAGDPSCQCLACYGETVQKRSLVFLVFLTRMDELWSCCFCRNPCVLCMSFLLVSDHSELMCRQSRKCGSALIDR